MFVPGSKLLIVGDAEGKLTILNTNSSPPRPVHTTQTGAKGDIRGMAFDELESNLFVSSVYENCVFGYSLTYKPDTNLTKVFTIPYAKNVKSLAFLPGEKSLLLGLGSGIVEAYDVSKMKPSIPHC